MALQVPNRVREALGDEAIVEFVPWLQDLIRQYSVPRDEYREVLSRLDGMEKDISLIKEELTEAREDRGQMRTEFREGQAQLRAEFQEQQTQMRAEFNELRRDMNTHFDEINQQIVIQTRWFIGALTVLVTVVSALMAIVQFTP